MRASAAVIGSVDDALFAPARELLAECEQVRHCPELPDLTWLLLELHGILQLVPSGRALLQEYGHQFVGCPTLGHYFEALKSPRRLRLAVELNQRLCTRIAQTLPDALAADDELAEFDVYAGDGHWHGAADHDAVQG